MKLLSPRIMPYWHQWNARLVALLSTMLEDSWLFVFAYRDNDHPEVWHIAELGDVYLNVENTVHYALDTAFGRAEWNTTLPSHGIRLHFGADASETFTVSLFHQLYCLNVIRIALSKFSDPEVRQLPQVETVQCMDYIRQMVLCRANLRLESARNPTGPGIAVADVTHTCKDWTAVYSAAQENWEAYVGQEN
ncbi:hypothetical protein D9757_004013 [Collybiopsis confluens]|uniref:Uncharacterized protein n=1 Tax=Collybiopsis confluens TaxID=2823264 RepID=A0A8H5MEE4_9AGAR|nr:hypothetical protein D9757_004013 [Collybiopsis confluens]